MCFLFCSVPYVHLQQHGKLSIRAYTLVLSTFVVQILERDAALYHFGRLVLIKLLLCPSSLQPVRYAVRNPELRKSNKIPYISRAL